MRSTSTFALVLLPVALLLLAVLRLPQYGLVEPGPVGPYLNGAFPPAVTDSTPAPPLLSMTGAFDDLETLTPAQGVIPYALNAPFWSDGAIKSRWIAIPNDGTHDTPEEQVVYSEEGLWFYPEGTVAIKHFDMDTDLTESDPLRRLETRFVVAGPNDQYYFLTYRWNEEGTDAVLLETSQEETLAIRTASGVRFQSWLYPSQENCIDCHRYISGSFLGPSARQLNGDLLYPETGVISNQLATWNNLGIFSEPINEDSLAFILTAKHHDDENASLEERALSYLDSNCGYCHFPGSIRTAAFDARMTRPLERSAIINGTVFNNNNIQNARVVAPGDTAKSLVYFRMRNLGNKAAMPPLAKSVVDSAGLKLMEEWILSLGSGVNVEEEAGYPEEIEVTVYPSPFVNQARVAYTLNAPAAVAMDVFDATGRRVQRVDLGTQPSGNHTTELSGESLANGIYYVRLTAGNAAVSRAVVKY